MAQIPPETKAAALVDLAGGMSYNKVSAKHGVGKGTVAEWAKELKEGGLLNARPSEPRTTDSPAVSEEARQQMFNQALQDCLLDALGMVRAWARECSNPEFIRANPGGVRELGQVVLDRADKLVSSVELSRDAPGRGDLRGVASDQLPPGSQQGACGSAP